MTLNKIELFKILALSGVKYLIGTAIGLSFRLLLGEYLKHPNCVWNLLGVKCFLTYPNYNVYTLL